MRNLLRAVLIAIFMFAGTAWAVETGYIHSISGDVTITRAGKSPAKAKLGDLFEEGTIFSTGLDGKVVMRFADGQVVALAPQTQFTVTSYVYNTASTSQSNILFSLARGGMRFVTGLIGQTDHSKFAVRTPTMTAGVRGTKAIIIQDEKSGTLVKVEEGIVTITTSKGTMVINGGNYLFWGPNDVVGDPATAKSGTVFTRDSAGNLTDVGVILNELAILEGMDTPPNVPVNVFDAAQAVVQSAAGAPGGPNPTPAPSGGGGGGTGVSPS